MGKTVKAWINYKISTGAKKEKDCFPYFQVT